MPSIRKHKGAKWIAEARKNGQYKSKVFDNKLDAHQWAVEKEIEFSRGDDVIRGKTLGDAFERYAREVSPTKKGEQWEVIRLNKLSNDPLALVLMEELNYEDINAFIHRSLESIKASSVNRELTLVRSVIEIARKRWKWCNLAVNPVSEADKPKNPPARDRRISADEIERILDALGYVDGEPVKTQRQATAVAFLIALETGMRQGELWKLEWLEVHLNRCYLTLNETKNGTRRNVPLSTRAIELFKQLKPLHKQRVLPYRQASCGQMFRGALKIAGVEGLTFHDTRHEAVSRLARKLDMLDLARMIGHRDPRSLMVYYNATAEEIAQRLN